jgi:hypothetical protein
MCLSRIVAPQLLGTNACTARGDKRTKETAVLTRWPTLDGRRSNIIQSKQNQSKQMIKSDSV